MGRSVGGKTALNCRNQLVVGSLTAASLLEILAKGIQDTLSKKMPPRNAGALAQLCSAAYRVLPTANLENRVARLEQKSAEQENRTSVDTDPTNSCKLDQSGGDKEVELNNVETKESGDGEEGTSDRADQEDKA